MNQEQVVELVLQRFNAKSIVYMLTGGIAVSYYGRPRFTHDIDFVVQASLDDASLFESLFQNDFYVSKEGIIDAVQHHSMFNLIHNDTGLKIDCWVAGNDEYARIALSRRVKRPLFRSEAYISTAEDLILTKLDWFRKSDVQKHYDDVVGTLQVQSGRLDMHYLDEWARQMNLDDLLAEAIKSSEAE